MQFRIGYPIDSNMQEERCLIVVGAKNSPGQHLVKGGMTGNLKDKTGAYFVWERTEDFIRKENHYFFDPVGIDKMKIQALSPSDLTDYGYSDSAACLLGLIQYTSNYIDRNTIDNAPIVSISCAFCYQDIDLGWKRLRLKRVTPEPRTVSDSEKVQISLGNKWQATCNCKALALVLHEDDALLLSQKIGKEAMNIQKFKNVVEQGKGCQPYLVSCKSDQLSDLAEALKIDSTIFKKEEVSKNSVALSLSLDVDLYVKHLENVNPIKLLGISHRRPISVERIFIPLQLKNDFNGYSYSILERLEQVPEELEGLEQVLKDAKKKSKKNVVIIVAPVGAGKTTLLQMFCKKLCYEYAKTKVIPIWLSPCQITNNQETIVSSTNIDYGKNSPIVLLCDGLDEVPKEKQKITIAILKGLLEKLDQNKAMAIVTCRSEQFYNIDGIDDLLTLSFPIYTILPLNRKSRLALFKNLLGSRNSHESLSLLEREQEIVKMAQEIENIWQKMPSRYKELFQTPLLVTFFGLVVIERYISTFTQIELYTLFEKALHLIIQQRVENLEERNAIIDILMYISHKIYLDSAKSAETTISQENLQKYLAEYTRYYPSQIRIGKLPFYFEQNPISVIRDSGIFVELEDGNIFEFWHRSFYEFLLVKQMEKELTRQPAEYITFSQEPLSALMMEFFSHFSLTQQLQEAIRTTKGKKFEDVRFRGGNSLNYLRRKAQLEPRELDLKDMVLAGADLRQADLSNIDFGKADLRYADWSYANLQESNWSQVQELGHLQIEEGKEIRSCVYWEQNNTIFAGNARGNIFTVKYHNNKLNLYDMRKEAHQHSVTILAIDEVNSLLVSGGYDKRVNIWDISPLRFLYSLPRLFLKCRALAIKAWMQGNTYLLCGDTDNTLYLYQLVRQEKNKESPIHVEFRQVFPNIFGASYRNITWSPDGELVLITGFQGAIHFLSFVDGRLDKKIYSSAKDNFACWGGAFSNNGKYAATLDDRGCLTIWQINEGIPSHFVSFSLPKVNKNLDVIGRVVCLNQNAERIYCGTDDGIIYCLSRKKKNIKIEWHNKIHDDTLYTIRLIHQEQYILTCGLDAKICVLNAQNGFVLDSFIDNTKSQLDVSSLKIPVSKMDICDVKYLTARGAKVDVDA